MVVSAQGAWGALVAAEFIKWLIAIQGEVGSESAALQ